MTATLEPHRFSPPPSDGELLRAATTGDAAAFRHLFDRHAAAIRSYLIARLGPIAADDVLAETFAAAWVSRARFRVDADSARPWLYGIATVHAKRHQAAETRWQRASHAERQVAIGERPQEEIAASCSPALAQALSALSMKEREILLLVALGDLTVAMAARAVGISPVAARMRLHRARRQVARSLASHEGRSNA
ncbi:MAG: RNA polymerase sigma factor [Thermoleophilia bacterium]|nr:RNA polymerase sigma factor [Thermoleophilia bacterium]